MVIGFVAVPIMFRVPLTSRPPLMVRVTPGVTTTVAPTSMVKPLIIATDPVMQYGESAAVTSRLVTLPLGSVVVHV